MASSVIYRVKLLEYLIFLIFFFQKDSAWSSASGTSIDCFHPLSVELKFKKLPESIKNNTKKTRLKNTRLKWATTEIDSPRRSS